MGRKKRWGEMLRQLREGKGLTQVQLAEKAGITQEYVAKLETGAKANPTMDVLKRLAKALGVTVGELLE